MPDTPHIGTDRQLFVDDYWIDETKGARRVLHSPVRREVAIPSEHPWERDGVSYMVAFPDGEKFRAWYRCDADLAREEREPLIAYAESDDGIQWHKPTLGVIEREGSTRNNLVWNGPHNNMSPFRDDNPDARPDERYKAIVRSGAVFGLVSPDGIRWRMMQDEPILTEKPFDSHNIAFWDTWRGEYVVYARGFMGGHPREGGVRWVRQATSSDFRNWSDLVPIDAGDAPPEQLYTNACVQYERAPGTYLMFPSRFVPEREPIPGWEAGPGVSDIVFMSSRDGLRFDRSFMEAFVRPGPDEGNWHERAIYMERGVLHTSPTEMSLYGMENWRLPSVCIRRYSLRADGFVSVNGGYSGGEITTRPFTFSGDALVLNYSTSAVGSVRVEVQDADGTPDRGFALGDCDGIFGDEIDGVVLSGPSLGALAGKPVRLRLALMDADVYSFRFSDSRAL